MFRWAEHVDVDHVQRVRDAFDELADQATGLRHHAHGSDVGVSEGTFDYLVVADFDTVADWRAYRDHPTHVLLVGELITGHVVEQAGGQYQTPDDRSARDVAMGARPAMLADGDDPLIEDESDEQILERARRAAMAEMEALYAEPDEPG